MSGIPTIVSSISYCQETKRFRSWYQHGTRNEDGSFTPTSGKIDDTHTSTQAELWEMAQGLGIFAPYPDEENAK